VNSHFPNRSGPSLPSVRNRLRIAGKFLDVDLADLSEPLAHADKPAVGLRMERIAYVPMRGRWQLGPERCDP
jgi:hypothetical protein